MLSKEPRLIKLKIYPMCLSGSLNCSTKILKKLYEIKNTKDIIP